MRRTLSWLLVLPFAATSILLGHTIAYRVTGMPLGDVHGYLEHVPQVVFVLASIALVGLAADARRRRRSPAGLASLAAIGFVAQEHLERLIHTGHLPFLLASPALWLGIALQLPLAALVWLLARRLAEEIAAPTRRSAPRLSVLKVAVATLLDAYPFSAPIVSQLGRAPPVSS